MASLDEYLDAVAVFLRSASGSLSTSNSHDWICPLVVCIGSLANQKIAGIGFSAERVQELSSKILEATQRNVATADAERRRPMQDWTALSAYLIEAH